MAKLYCGNRVVDNVLCYYWNIDDFISENTRGNYYKRGGWY